MVVPFLFAATRNRMFAGSVCVQLSLSHRSSYIWLGNPGLVDRRLDLASLEMEKIKCTGCSGKVDHQAPCAVVALLFSPLTLAHRRNSLVFN